MNVNTGPAFSVLYRWRLHPGKEEQFVQAWTQISYSLLHERGSLGSRLHRGDDNIWYSYAQWPSEEKRRLAFSIPAVDAEASIKMRDAIADNFPEVVLKSVSDLMIAVPENDAVYLPSEPE